MTVQTTTPTPTTTAAEVKVGDFFVSEWGYDQSNVDYYKVVGRTAKSVRLQAWNSTAAGVDTKVPGNGPRQCHVWPYVTADDLDGCRFCSTSYNRVDRDCPTHGPRAQDSPVRLHRLSTGGWSGPAVTLNSYSAAYLWDGRGRYQTPSGGGH